MFYKTEFLTDVIVVLVQPKFEEVTDGKWLVEIKGKNKRPRSDPYPCRQSARQRGWYGVLLWIDIYQK